MIRRLIILLLIVGCAPTKPTTANFYLGMNKEEFDIKNSNIIPDQFPHKLAHTQTVVDKTIPDNTYIFYFENECQPFYIIVHTVESSPMGCN